MEEWGDVKFANEGFHFVEIQTSDNGHEKDTICYHGDIVSDELVSLQQSHSE